MKYIEEKDINEEAHSKIVYDLLKKAKRYENLDRLPISVATPENEFRELIKILGIYIEEQERKNDYLLKRIEELETEIYDEECPPIEIFDSDDCKGLVNVYGKK